MERREAVESLAQSGRVRVSVRGRVKRGRVESVRVRDLERSWEIRIIIEDSRSPSSVTSSIRSATNWEGLV